ncbi:type II toxin-antitoxin system Phd/YefM family antitoxin [Methylovulum psychrotolerans]|jgi:prevent-host-death family protein|uniref:Antitoxin n=1 Tax=Methylovulum psychrotolerans TaxID=1704499 RepID=A0A2S5CFM4_9GAMM|nr:type II toxin-antitoxin system Phd/YefM family antitoxin [Methylovulum psychrotolerans]MBT9100521.1 type II toxin-antitoxin system Phd/YefM family antitoxin [Methylovulum psychrotolerans]POZ49567.1 prevent-host-death protein [Methylovulum psychrotolerans]
MVTISSAEFQRHFGRYQDVALTEPVAITRNGRERVVVLSVDEYQRLKRRDRIVLSVDDFTEEDLQNIRKAEPPIESIAFNAELIG